MTIEPADVRVGDDGVTRCRWSLGNPIYEAYHDLEWGRPVADDRRLFEKISLEGFQSGLSWLTILRKRENFRRAFRSFDADVVARFDRRSVERLMRDAGIVRNRAKIEATINNARRYLDLREEMGSLAAYVWTFEPDERGHSAPATLDELTARGIPAEGGAMSKDLKRRGWSFIGPTTTYSFMQAIGMVNDHLDGCDIRPVVAAERARFTRPQPKQNRDGHQTR